MGLKPMKQVEQGEGAMYTESGIAQLGIGKLHIETMTFPTSYAGIQTSYQITVYAGSADAVGWGDRIFEGSLQELIQLVAEAQKARATDVITTA